jgi:hypothetical protein
VTDVSFAVCAQDMMLMCTQFQPMRWGLGLALLTDGYFGHDPTGGAFYGVPTWYTEYEADLGFPLGDATMLVNGSGHAEVWTREFERGLVVINGLPDTHYNFTLPAGKSYRKLGASKRPARITGGREAPLIQFVIDNGAPHCGVLGPTDQARACSFKSYTDYGQPPPAPPSSPAARNCSARLRKNATDCPLAKSKFSAKHASGGITGVLSADACCELCIADSTCTGWVYDTIHNDPTTGKIGCWYVQSV